MHTILFLLLFTCIFCAIEASATINPNLPTKYDVILKTPKNELVFLSKTFKSVHIRYILPHNADSWSIVEIEPWISNSSNDIYQIIVHRCHDGRQNSIWYDDPTGCMGNRAMLIYQWTLNTPRTKFQISDDLGFQVDRSKSIVLSIVYLKEQTSFSDQSGVIITICTLNPRFHIGTTLIRNTHKTTQFSCRASNYPRLLYAVQPLFSKINNISWNIYVIRNRKFGRKLVQFVLDSLIVSKHNETNFELIPSDIFLVPGDYILVQCIHSINIDCQFLIYYTYKNLHYEYFDEDDYICDNDNYPDLFKLIPLKTKESSPEISIIDGKTIFLLVCLLLCLVWISIIIGCVIIRRIRGLVNFRSEPMTPLIGQQNKLLKNPQQIARERQQEQKIIQEGDNIAQLDIEHMGLMS